MIAAFVLAAWSSLGFVALVGGAAAGLAEQVGGDRALGLLWLLFVGIPAVVGTALGMSARRPEGPNPVSVWIALVWNALLLGSMVLLVVVGIFTK